MIYEYQCQNSDCGAITERVQRMADPRPETIPCRYCEAEAQFKISAPAVLTGGMSNHPFDVAVGRDAEIRWKDIHEQQAAREKVRKQANQVGLAATSYNNFQPISEQQKRVRTSVMDAVQRDGFKAETGS